MNKKELNNKLYAIEKEVKDLRQQLNKLVKPKETWFKKKEGQKKDISKLIKKIKDLKSKKELKSEIESNRTLDSDLQQVRSKVDEMLNYLGFEDYVE